MKIKEIVWLDTIIDKIYWKHNVGQDEVKEVLNSRPQVRFVEKGHRKNEDVYSALGRTEAGRLLIIFFVYKQDQSALIISAREMTRGERRLYEKK